jgi:hypothetical protein
MASSVVDGLQVVLSAIYKRGEAGVKKVVMQA